MAKFAQHYIKFKNGIGSYDWASREQHLAALLAKDDSITFATGKDESHKTYNHRVYHLRANPSIVVMQFANMLDVPLEQQYEPAVARDEPSCFVIFDNRSHLRTVAIQKRRKAFSSSTQVAKILSKDMDSALFGKYCYGMEILPEYYPEDLYTAWGKLQSHAANLIFSSPDMPREQVRQRLEELKAQDKEYYDDSLMQALLQLFCKAKENKYRQRFTVMPEDVHAEMKVDKNSTYIKNLISVSRATNTPVDITTTDGATYRCFVDSVEDNTDKVACREFDATKLETLFRGKMKDGTAAEPAYIDEVEAGVIEFMNKMKHELNEQEEQEAVVA